MSLGYATILGSSLLALSVCARGAYAQARWQLSIEQRFVLDDGLADPIKDLRDFAVGGDGRVYVLENTVKQVHVDLANGRYSKSFSRNGSGPGELRDANGVVAAADGTLWLNDHGNSRITNLSADSLYLRQMQSHALGYRFRWQGFIGADGALYDELFSARPRGSPALHVIERRRLDGRVLDTFSITACPGDSERKTHFRAESIKDRRSVFAQIPFVAQRLSALDFRGAVWCNVGTAYRVLRPDLKSGAVTAEAPREAHRTHTEFDVFDERGRFLATATLAGRTSAFARKRVHGDMSYAVVLDEDDVPSIVRARIVTGTR